MIVILLNLYRKIAFKYEGDGAFAPNKSIQEHKRFYNLVNRSDLPSIALEIIPFISSTRPRFCGLVAAVSSGVCNEANFCVMSFTVASRFKVGDTSPLQ